MKKKVLKCVLLCVVGILALYFSFMVGRFSWLIEKPTFLLSAREKFWVHKAREELLRDGYAKEKLCDPWVRHAVIVHFKNDAGENTVRMTLDKISGEILSWWGREPLGRQLRPYIELKTESMNTEPNQSDVEELIRILMRDANITPAEYDRITSFSKEHAQWIKKIEQEFNEFNKEQNLTPKRKVELGSWLIELGPNQP